MARESPGFGRGRKGGSETRQGLSFREVLERNRPSEKFSRPLRARPVLGEDAELEAERGGMRPRRPWAHVERDGGGGPAGHAAGGHDEGEPLLRLAVRMRGAQFLDGSPVDEAAEPEVEEGTQLYKLVDAHLALPVEHVPEPLTVDADPTSQLGYADAVPLAHVLDCSNDGSVGCNQTSGTLHDLGFPMDGVSRHLDMSPASKR